MTQIINNEKIDLNLCRECAEKRGFHSPLEGKAFPLAEFLASILDQSLQKVPPELKESKCSVCRIGYSDFVKSGRLGCGNCYKIFRPQLKDLLRKIHGSDVHRGKIPGAGEDVMKPVREQRRLQEQLKKAVEAEDFEKAARIRDRIKALERGV
jgi:protein arginine kinase activator